MDAGTVDAENEFSNIAVLRFLDIDGDDRWRCTGTLVAPNAIITAAHCTEGAEQVYYSLAVIRPTVEPDCVDPENLEETGWTLRGDDSVPDERNIPRTPTGTAICRTTPSTTRG